MGKQLLRSAMSVGAQYREAQRAKSIADFVSKCEGSLQELEESAYWFELIEASGTRSDAAIQELYFEARELIAIFVVLVRTAKTTRADA
jgi:four helix bundle protein